MRFDAQHWGELRRKLQLRSYTTSKESYEVIRSMLAGLNDPFTRFVEPEEVERSQNESNELSGVGIKLVANKQTKEIVVETPFEGSPAWNAGVESNDVVLAIDGAATTGMTIDDAVNLIRGPAGTRVSMKLLRNGRTFVLPLTREKFKLRRLVYRINLTSNGGKVGYIRPREFNYTSAEDMKIAIRDLESRAAQGFVLDLRSNPGGLLNQSVEAAKLWLDNGIIVKTVSRNGKQDVKRAEGPALTKLPLVILVNQGTAAASEVLASALRDNRRALIVGEKTYGLGRVQIFRKLSDGSGVYVTNGVYLTPKGEPIEKVGVLPDIVSVFSEADVLKLALRDIGTPKDFQYRVAEEALMQAPR